MSRKNVFIPKRILLYTALCLFLIGLIFTATYLKSVADYKKAVK